MDAEQPHANIIEAVGQVFAECGYHAATVRKVCKRTGANVDAVNYYFGDKIGLYTEVLHYAARAAREGIAAALEDQGAPEDVLKKEGAKNRATVGRSKGRQP
jgi:TetR/AcrR family transcriptional regulator, regulator of cefoperazone and chloramphenicol sensitivity